MVSLLREIAVAQGIGCETNSPAVSSLALRIERPRDEVFEGHAAGRSIRAAASWLEGRVHAACPKGCLPGR
jgi:hypothetical protein